MYLQTKYGGNVIACLLYPEWREHELKPRSTKILSLKVPPLTEYVNLRP